MCALAICEEEQGLFGGEEIKERVDSSFRKRPQNEDCLLRWGPSTSGLRLHTTQQLEACVGTRRSFSESSLNQSSPTACVTQCDIFFHSLVFYASQTTTLTLLLLLTSHH